MCICATVGGGSASGKRVFAIDCLRWIDVALWSHWKIKSINIVIYSTPLAINNIEWINSMNIVPYSSILAKHNIDHINSIHDH